MNCPNCGKAIDVNATVCVYCGSMVPVKPPVPMQTPQQGTYQDPYQNTQQGPYQDPYQNPYQNPYNNPYAKSKMAAGLLGILLGAFGVHNFYLGYNGKAIVQLLFTLLSCGILAVIPAIWGMIEGIIILTSTTYLDAQGIPLRN